MANIVRAGRNALTKLAPRAIQGASRAVALVAGSDAARRAEMAGAFATVMATVGSFMSGRRARRVLEEIEQNPALSFEVVLSRLAQLGEAERDLAEAEVRRMVRDLGDAIATEAVSPILKALVAWARDDLVREQCVSAAALLRDLDRGEIELLEGLLRRALEQHDALLRFIVADQSRDHLRLLERLQATELATRDGTVFALSRRRGELLSRLLASGGY